MTRGLDAADGVVHGRALAAGFDETCDAVVVGSGAGGAVVAATLAEAGLRVIVLEEGPYYAPEEYARFQPSESLRRMFRDAGMLAAFGIGQTPIISLTMGRVVGGSSVLTGGVCFRIPGEVHQSWARDLGLAEHDERAFEPAYREVERRLGVEEVPAAMRSRSTELFVRGAERLGVPMEPIRRNTAGCEGNSRCNFGCPVGAKRSVDTTYLPGALRRGARVLSDALVLRVLTDGGRAAGVEGRLLGGPHGAPSHRFRVRAPIVVAACGTVHTPLLLLRSGLGRRARALGRHITLHPAARVVARFDEPVHGWDGALQSVYSDRFADEGIKLVSVYTAVNLLAAGLPGVGPTLRRRAAALRCSAVFGAMIHDEGGGRVVPRPFGREPLLLYEMAPRDLARLRRAVAILVELALAAGAREVFPPVFGAPPVDSSAGVRALETAPLDARRIECMAFHPLGSARMATDARRGVVDARGEAFELPGLFVADGSVLPTSIGVNSQLPIMAMATRLAWGLRDRWSPRRGGLAA